MVVKRVQNVYSILNSILMKVTTKYIIWVLGVLGLLFSLLWIYIDFHEVYGILSGKLINDYPWGNVASNPWYYSAPTIYWIFCFVSGLINLTAVFVITNGMFYKRHKRMIIGLAITVLNFLILLTSVYLVEQPA